MMPIVSVKNMLIAIARGMYGDIAPSSRRASLMDCFDVCNGRLYLYFNIDNDSTRVVSADINAIPGDE